MTTRRLLVAVLTVVTIVVLAMSACSAKAKEQFQDAPRGSTNSAAADIVEMPDGWSNVASKCDGPNRVYVIFHNDANYGAVAVVANDPRCTSAAALR